MDLTTKNQKMLITLITPVLGRKKNVLKKVFNPGELREHRFAEESHTFLS